MEMITFVVKNQVMKDSNIFIFLILLNWMLKQFSEAQFAQINAHKKVIKLNANLLQPLKIAAILSLNTIQKKSLDTVSQVLLMIYLKKWNTGGSKPWVLSYKTQLALNSMICIFLQEPFTAVLEWD